MNIHRPVIARLCPLIDLAIAIALTINGTKITNFICSLFDWSLAPNFDGLEKYPLFVLFALMGIPIVLSHVGFYRRNNLQPPKRALQQLLYFTAYALCTALLYQVVHNTYIFIERVVIVTLILTNMAFFLRYALVRWLQLNTALGQRNLNQILLVGTTADIEIGWESLSSEWKQGRNRQPLKAIIDEMTAQEVQELIQNHSIEAAFIFGREFHQKECNKIVYLLGAQGIDINLQLDGRQGLYSRTRLETVGKSQILTLSSGPEYTWSYMIKGLIDRLLALIILICSSPLWIIAAIGIKISDPSGKIFYQQQRSGLYGKPFGMWKFRSMYEGADEQLDEIKAEYGNEVDGPIFKLTDDPRIFPFGHFIRQTSMDELPQLLNVLTGDMSIVGPRPLPLYETAEFTDPCHRRRLSVKPGLTCYWQIEERSNATDFEVMIRKDLKYIDNWSLWLDFSLFLRTIPAVLLRRGAK